MIFKFITWTEVPTKHVNVFKVHDMGRGTYQIHQYLQVHHMERCPCQIHRRDGFKLTTLTELLTKHVYGFKFVTRKEVPFKYTSDVTFSVWKEVPTQGMVGGTESLSQCVKPGLQYTPSYFLCQLGPLGLLPLLRVWNYTFSDVEVNHSESSR